MIVAIFGRSCSGKTALASAVASLLKFSVRHCGDAIREAASAADVSIDELSIEQHQKVDQATYQWASASGVALVEGRFLQYVLSSFERPLLLVEVTCSASVREVRWGDRMGQPVDAQSLAEMDESEDRLVQSLYSSIMPRIAELAIDTTTLSVDECAQQVVAAVVRLGGA